MTTRVTEDSRRFFLSSQAAALVSRVDARARVHSSPLTNSEEKRETTLTQTTLHLFGCFVEMLFIATTESEKLLFCQ